MTYGAPGGRPSESDVLQTESVNGLAETVLATNTSLQARPVLAVGPNGHMALVWNSQSGSGAADAISLRLFDGAAWGSPITISQAGRPAFNPTAVFAPNGDLLVAWVEAQSAPDPNELTEAFARSMEIAWAEVNASTGQIVRQGKLTNDNVLDFAPRLAAAPDGAVWLAWVNSPGTSLTGTAASPNRLLAASWTGSGWAATETVNQNQVGTLYWDIAAADANTVWIVADRDMDGSLATAADRELFLYRRSDTGWTTPTRLTNDAVIDGSPLLAVTSGGQFALAWLHGDTVLGLTGDPSTQPAVWFGADVGIGPMLGGGKLLAGPDGGLTLLWPEGTDQGQDIWLSRYNPGRQTWSSPAPLFHSAEQRRSLTAHLQANGDVLLGLTAAQVSDQQVDFDGGGVAMVPTVADSARLLVARVPADYVPAPEQPLLFLPRVSR